MTEAQQDPTRVLVDFFVSQPNTGFKIRDVASATGLESQMVRHWCHQRATATGSVHTMKIYRPLRGKFRKVAHGTYGYFPSMDKPRAPTTPTIQRGMLLEVVKSTEQRTLLMCEDGDLYVADSLRRVEV